MANHIKTRIINDSGYVQHGLTRYPTTYKVIDEINTSTAPYPPGGSFWKHEKWSVRGGRINGGPDNDGNNLYVNVPTAVIANRNLPSILAPDDAPSIGSMATKLLAETNPNTPVVNVPVFVKELPELARLLRLEGGEIVDLFRRRKVSKGLASLNLEYQFGWKPFISDLVKLLTFQGEVDRRIRTLNEMRDRGFKSFKRTLYKGSRASSYHENINDIATWEGYLLSIWGYVVWYPDAELPSTAEEMKRLADRAVFGLNGSLASVWEALPWSWLVDWCSNIGAYLDAQRNFIPVKHSTPQIMVHMKRQAQHESKTFWEGGRWSLSPGVYTHETKERFIVSASLPEAKLPFLNEGQFSILASIGVLSRRGR